MQRDFTCKFTSFLTKYRQWLLQTAASLSAILECTKTSAQSNPLPYPTFPASPRILISVATILLVVFHQVQEFGGTILCRIVDY